MNIGFEDLAAFDHVPALDHVLTRDHRTRRRALLADGDHEIPMLADEPIQVLALLVVDVDTDLVHDLDRLETHE